MSVSWMIKSFLATLLLPPGNGLLLLAIAGAFRRRRWSWSLAVVAFALLFLPSLHPLAEAVIESLERRAGPVVTDVRGAGAIVILAGGRDRNMPEYGGDTVSALSLERLRYGAILAKRYGLPVLATGGSPGGEAKSEAELIAEVLKRELGVAVRWTEADSADTADNAAMSARILRAAGIGRVVLVTHAFHMPRARRAFERAGLEIIPAPMGFKAARSGLPQRAHEWLPQIGALRVSNWALHEWIGIAWYEISATF